MSNFIIKGDICYSKDPTTLNCMQGGYLVCEDGKTAGVFGTVPERYATLPVHDTNGKLIVPGLTDLHLHAPQYAFRGLGMDLELLDWLNTHTFPEESKYADLEYARKAYEALAADLLNSGTTRASLFGTLHLPATELLMDILEETGIVSLVGKVNMDRNSPDNLREENAAASVKATRDWVEHCNGKYKNVRPILTPRFIPSCTDELMHALADLQKEYHLPVQSHLSENQSEISWVGELCPNSTSYSGAYHDFGLFGGDVPTVMAHGVWLNQDDIDFAAKQGVWIAHCPQSNENLSSGIAPIRKLMNSGVNVGLGSDIAGGCHTSIFRAMADAIQASKLHWRLVDQADAPLTVPEAFYLGTVGGGSFFGKVGSFANGYEFDALVLDDAALAAPFACTIEERLARAIYLSDDRHIVEKYVAGQKVLDKHTQQ